jgi:predicted cobalt transporter CbtA
MRMTRLSFVVMLALLAGLVGGALLSQTQMVKTVLAQESFRPEEFVSAKEFRLVDANGKTLAVLGGHPGKEPFLPIEPALRFYDNDRELVVLLGLVPGNKPKLALFDGHGKTIWETP